MKQKDDKEAQKLKQISEIVKRHIDTLKKRIKEADTEALIKSKNKNPFINDLDEEIIFYSAFIRSFDSIYGGIIEDMVIEIAGLSYTVSTTIEGYVTPDQQLKISEILFKYSEREKRSAKKPEVVDYADLRERSNESNEAKNFKSVKSDMYLIDTDTDTHYLIELKMGGNLDNKKARAEKENLLRQLVIISSKLDLDKNIKIYFCTAYGESSNELGSVPNYFANGELLIGKDFWKFITKCDNGFEAITNVISKQSQKISQIISEKKQSIISSQSST